MKHSVLKRLLALLALCLALALLSFACRVQLVIQQ